MCESLKRMKTINQAITNIGKVWGPAIEAAFRDDYQRYRERANSGAAKTKLVEQTKRNLARYIREAREAKPLTLEEWASRARVPPRSVAKIAQGDYSGSAPILAKALKALGCPKCWKTLELLRKLQGRRVYGRQRRRSSGDAL